MPCNQCESPLFVSHHTGDLRCPDCASLSVPSLNQISEEINSMQDYMGEPAILNYLKQYQKNQLILSLIRVGNKAAANIFDTGGIPIKEFAFSTRFIKLLISETGFGDKSLDLDRLPPRPLESVLTYDFSVLRRLDQLEDRYKYAYPRVSTPGKSNFLDKYVIHNSEFGYCFERNLRSLVGAREENRELFDRKSLNFHDFDAPSGDEYETVREFAETFYELIVSMSFLLSSSTSLNQVYQQHPPKEVTAVNLDELLNLLDVTFSQKALDLMHETGELGVAEWSQLQAAGEVVYGDSWENVRDEIVMYPGNEDAHPFLFALPLPESVSTGRNRPPIEVSSRKVLYPRHYSRLIRFQMFPLLHDENGQPGKDILASIQSARGKPYERNVYNYLEEEGFTVFHSVEHQKKDTHELDLLVVEEANEELWFIECKYLLPEVNMDHSEGVQEYNDKIGGRVFPQDGEGFNEKVNWWINNKVGERFTYQKGPEKGDRRAHKFFSYWGDYDTRRFVVSPVAPSYTVKRGIRFLTDMEFLEFLETSELPLIPKREEWIVGSGPN